MLVINGFDKDKAYGKTLLFAKVENMMRTI
jgi:hypothetical protein